MEFILLGMIGVALYVGIAYVAGHFMAAIGKDRELVPIGLIWPILLAAILFGWVERKIQLWRRK